MYVKAKASVSKLVNGMARDEQVMLGAAVFSLYGKEGAEGCDSESNAGYGREYDRGLYGAEGVFFL